MMKLAIALSLLIISTLLAEAKRLSRNLTDNHDPFNRHMLEAKRQGMSWADGLVFAIDRMKQPRTCG